MKVVATFAAGLLFGLGLVVSGLINPAKVQSFLDVFGAWDPSLAVTMAAAVATTMIGYRLIFTRAEPLLGGVFQLPTVTDIDTGLVSGAAVFGIGWGLIGFCPGPAVAGLSSGSTQVIIFVVAMLGGMALARGIERSKLPAAANMQKKK
jgi:uncharacterized protein